jgi:hypothetical protein
MLSISTPNTGFIYDIFHAKFTERELCHGTTVRLKILSSRRIPQGEDAAATLTFAMRWTRLLIHIIMQ